METLKTVLAFIGVVAKDVTFCYVWKFNKWERNVIKWFKGLWKR